MIVKAPLSQLDLLLIDMALVALQDKVTKDAFKSKLDRATLLSNINSLKNIFNKARKVTVEIEK